MVLDGIYVDGEKAKFNPEDILSGNIPDYSDKVIAAVRNFGNYVEYRELLGQSHGATCTLVNGSTRAEAISWFNRFRNADVSTD